MLREDKPVGSPRMQRVTIKRGIRTALMRAESATQAELCHALEISFPTISKFLAELVATGEVKPAGVDASSGGRPAKRYAYNPEFRLGLAMYLERTETRYRVFNSFGHVKEQGGVSGFLDANPERLYSELERLLAKFPGIGSLAIGVPGAVNQGRIIHIPDYPEYQDIDLQSLLEARYSLPAVVENDMNAAVYGYFTQRENPERSSVVYLYSGQNGPGAGIVIDGSVMRGSTFFSGEVSYVPQYNDRNFLQALQNGEEEKHKAEKGKNTQEEKETIDEKEDGNEKKQVGRLGSVFEIDALSRLIAAFAAIVNPHVVVMSQDDVDESILAAVAERSSHYIPRQHLPGLVTSDWQRDYLDGLQQLSLEKMIIAADDEESVKK